MSPSLILFSCYFDHRIKKAEKTNRKPGMKSSMTIASSRLHIDPEPRPVPDLKTMHASRRVMETGSKPLVWEGPGTMGTHLRGTNGLQLPTACFLVTFTRVVGQIWIESDRPTQIADLGR